MLMGVLRGLQITLGPLGMILELLMTPWEFFGDTSTWGHVGGTSGHIWEFWEHFGSTVGTRKDILGSSVHFGTLRAVRNTLKGI